MFRVIMAYQAPEPAGPLRPRASPPPAADRGVTQLGVQVASGHGMTILPSARIVKIQTNFQVLQVSISMSVTARVTVALTDLVMSLMLS